MTSVAAVTWLKNNEKINAARVRWVCECSAVVGCCVFRSWLATELASVLSAQLASSLCEPSDAKSFPRLSLRLSTTPRFVHSKWPLSVTGGFCGLCRHISSLFASLFVCFYVSPIFLANVSLFMTCSQEALSQMSTTNVVEVWQPEDADPFVPLQVIIPSVLCLYQQTTMFCVCQNLQTARSRPRVRVGRLCFPSVCNAARCAPHLYIYNIWSSALWLIFTVWSVFIYWLTSLTFFNVPLS